MAIITRLLMGAILLAAAADAQTRAVPVIFDTDIGDDIDDALALALILQSPELDLRAVTTVVDDTETRSRLAWKELKLYGRPDVPVGTGAPEPLLDARRKERARQFEVLTDDDKQPPYRSAVPLIIETLEKSAVRMTLIPVGPLTNIALALKTQPSIKNKIERIVLMGGAFFPPRAEYNILRDRVAAEIVFRSGIPIVAVGLDVTMKCKLEGADLDRMRKAENPATRFLVRLIELWQNGNPQQTPTLHDPLAVAAAIRGSLIETTAGEVHVETASPLTYGTTVFRSTGYGATLTRVARDVRVREFLDLFTARLAAQPRQ